MIAQMKVRARYAETDQMGIIHHAVYPVWYEEARSDYCRQIGLPYSQMEKLGVMNPLLSLECRYLRPCRYEDQVLVKTWISELSASRIRFCYALYLPEEDMPVHLGSTQHAWVDAHTFRPLNLKKKYPQWYEKFSLLLEQTDKKGLPCTS